MSKGLWWEAPKETGLSARHVARMLTALEEVRSIENAFVTFLDTANGDRYVQFANRGAGNEEAELTASVAVPVPVLIAVGAGAGSIEPIVAGGVPVDISSSGGLPYFSEPGHEPLLMEVGSGLWPKGNPKGLADDETVVARLAEIGLRLGGGRHQCMNFCRDDVTEPSDILATLCEHILVDILHARPTYRLSIRAGRFTETRRPGQRTA